MRDTTIEHEKLERLLTLLAVATFHTPALQAERTELVEAGLKALAAPVQEPVGRTDQQIVDQTEELAVWLLLWRYNRQPETDTGGAQMRESTHPFAERCWTAACHIQEMLTATDPENAVAELDATNRQVEILSDALAESRREVAALKPVQEPVAWANPSDLKNFDMKVRTNGGPLHTVALCLCTPPAAMMEMMK
jgi:hypothetical protein